MDFATYVEIVFIIVGTCLLGGIVLLCGLLWKYIRLESQPACNCPQCQFEQEDDEDVDVDPRWVETCFKEIRERNKDLDERGQDLMKFYE